MRFFLSLAVGMGVLLPAGAAAAAEAPVGLGTASSFAVLGGAGVTNTGPTVVNGDLGSCPAPAITGFPPGAVNGTVHAADAVACGAQSGVTIAYDDAAGRAPTTTFSGPTDLGGTTLTPGVYKSPSSFTVTGTLTLDAQDDPNAVFIFQAGSTLITATDSKVELINGADACNVFWQVGSSSVLGVGSSFVGTILALTSISADTNAVVQGRLLARNGSTTLDSNTITRPVCGAVSSTITVYPPVQGLFTLQAKLSETATGAPIAGRTVVFTTSAGTIGEAVTDAGGAASLSGLGAAGQIILDNGYTASFAGDVQFLASSAQATLLAGGTGSSPVGAGAPVPAGSGSSTVVPITSPGGPGGHLAATGGLGGTLEWGLLLLGAGGALALARSALHRR